MKMDKLLCDHCGKPCETIFYREDAHGEIVCEDCQENQFMCEECHSYYNLEDCIDSEDLICYWCGQ